jgi:hypothetical protein
MASEVWTFAVAIPPGTLASAPQLTDMAMPPRVVQTVEMRIPPGPRGQVGFALAAAGRQMIPSKDGQWIIGDDDRLSWPLDDQITSGAWQCRAYNVGQFAHTIYFRFLTAIPGEPALISPQDPLIPLSQLQPQ